MVMMQRTTAKSVVDGVNIKNTTCSHTVVSMWETWDSVACAYGNEAGGGGVLLQTTSTGWAVTWALRGPLHPLFQPTVNNISSEGRDDSIKN